MAVAGAKWEEEEREVMIPTTRKFAHRSIMIMSVPIPSSYRRNGTPLPAITHTAISNHTMRQDCMFNSSTPKGADMHPFF